VLAHDPYGPQYSRDNPFTARMRFHQSLWRYERLGESAGVDQRGNRYGNYLNVEAAKSGKNFLTTRIADCAAWRISSRGGVEEFRCRWNLLSAQPMAFTLFGPLQLDADFASRLLDSLLPRGVSQASVEIEWAPQRDSHLGDRRIMEKHKDGASGRRDPKVPRRGSE